jgi:hypothetical protein
MKVKRNMIISVVFIAAVLHAQEVKAPPKLKDSVALELKSLQLKVAESNIQLLQLQQQFSRTQDEAQKAQALLMEKLHSALKDSGLDEKKYDLDPNTLEIKEHAQPDKK